MSCTRAALDIGTRRVWRADRCTLLLPVVVIASLLIGLLEYVGELAGLYEPKVGFTLFALAEIIILVIVAWWAAMRIKRESAAGRENEDRYHKMFDLAAIGLSEGDVQTGQILWVNEKFCHITGYSAQELLGKPFPELTHPEDRQRDWEHFQQTLHEPGRTYSVEKRYLRKDGATVWVRVNVAAFERTRNGLPRRSIASVEDITEHKRAEEERQKFVSLADNSTEFIGMCDLNFMPVYANEAAIHLVGLESREEALKTHVSKFFFPEDRAYLFEEFFPRMVREGRGSTEIRFRHFRTGAALWIAFNAFYIRGTIGQPVGIATVSHDVTARRKAEEALRQREADLRIALDIGKLGEWKWDIVTGEITWSERCKALYGLSPDTEITYDFFLSCIHPDDRERVEAAVKRAMETRGEYEIEKRVIWPDGTVHWNSSRGRVFYSAAEEPILMTGVTMDVTERTRAEKALRVSEERLKQAVRVGGIGIFDHDLRTETIYFSPLLREFYGWDENVQITLPAVIEVIHPEDRERIVEEMRRTHDPAGDGIYNAEYRQQKPDGGIRWVSARAQTFFEGEGEARRPVRTVGAVQDITERKQAHEALRVSEERLKQAVRVTRLGIFEHDHRSGVIYWSPTMREIWGWGDHAPANAVEFVESVHPDDREALMAAILRSHDPTDNGLFEAEYRAIRRDGSLRWVIARGRTFFEGEGNTRRPNRSVGAALDITERKKAEEALRREKEFAEAVINSVPGTFYIFDSDGKYLRWNKNLEIASGYSTEEIERMHPLDFFAEQDKPYVAERVRDVFDRGHSFADVPMLTKDGRSIPYLFTGVRVLLEPGPCLVGVGIDITDRKRAEDELARLNMELEQRVAQRTAELESANRELEAFSYSVSHDLRAPLRAISSFTDIFVEEFGGQLTEEGRALIGRVQENAKKMGLLINDLLHFSRTTRQPLLLRKVDLVALTRECYQELGPLREGREIEFTVGALPPCEADPTLLRQVMLNLLSNAIKYSWDRLPARIEVGAIDRSGEVIYFVRDNGAGFDMEYASKLFGVFQRLHPASEYEGTGVGLAIVQRIIHRHGGRVWAEAEVGKGATFYFTLRRADNAGEGNHFAIRHPTLIGGSSTDAS